MRHITRRHELNCSPSNGGKTDQHLKFEAQRSGQPSSFQGYDWLLSHMLEKFTTEQKEPKWILMLRKLAEINKLLKDLSTPPASEGFVEPYKALIERPRISEPKFNIMNLTVLGYTAHICNECLISYLLTLYWDSTNMVQVPTIHKCDDDRLFEANQGLLNKSDAVATLNNELPNLLFHAVKKWTQDAPLLNAVEIPPALEGLQEIIPADKTRWAIHAIRNGTATLSDDELFDFLDLAGLKTYACFRIGGLTKKYQMYIATTATARDKTDKNTYPRSVRLNKCSTTTQSVGNNDNWNE